MNIEELNQNQKDAVTCELNPTLVVAGAGSGKTKVLTMRFLYLMEKYNFNHNEILTITFTNKAANEMKERLLKQIDVKYFNWVGTFHSFCLKVLREEYFNIYKKTFSIIDEEDQISILKEAYKNRGLEVKDFPYRVMLSKIEKFKKSNETYDSFRNEEVWRNQFHFKTLKQALEASHIFRYYLNKCHDSNYFDFNDLISETIEVFKMEDLRIKWANKFKAILVDEFQDTNDEQYELIKLLSKEHNNIFAVGDPDQMIYTWRGANPRIINNFSKEFENTKTIILDKNYRSSQAILNISNLLIENNIYRIKKNLVSATNIDNIIPVYFNGESQDDESRWIVNKIIELVNNGAKYSDICILYRSNYLSRNIEQTLMLNSIPYKIYGGMRFYQRREIKDILAYIKTCFVADDISIKRIINIPRRSISENTVSQVDEFARKNNVTFFDALINYQQIDGITNVGQKGIAKFIDTISSIKINEDHIQTFDNILEKSGYLDYLKLNEENDRIANINELRNTFVEYVKQNQDNSIMDFVQETSLYTSMEEGINTKDFVSLMTVHISKGLEFDTVFINGMNETIFPSNKSSNDKEALEEERRIAYVAITRAKKLLFLSSYSGFNYINNSFFIRSRFLDEIGISNLKLGSHKIKKLSTINEGWFDSKKKIDYSNNYTEEQRDFKIGDRIVHKIFGQGIIIGVRGINIDVSFNPPYNKKTLLANHKAIVRKLN